MSNLYDIGHNNLRFEIYNLLGLIDGHITVIFNTKSRQYCYKKHGEFGNLVSFRRVTNQYRKPLQAEADLLDGIVNRLIANSEYYERGKTPTKTNLIFTD